MEVRNPIKIGQTHELCLPTNNMAIEINELFNDKLLPVAEIHGGTHFCWMSCPVDPGPFALLREKINDFEAGQVVFD